MSHTPRVIAVAAVLLAVCGIAGSAAAQETNLGGTGPLFESATLGPTGQPAGTGWFLGVQTLLGWKFFVPGPTLVTEVGGHLVSRDDAMPPQTIFVAIVLLGLGGLPADTSLEGDAMFAATFVIDSPSAEFTVPTGGVELAAGNYGLIFGSGQFGADGLGNMPGNDTNVGLPEYFFCNVPSGCVDGGIDNARFFVDGVPGGLPPEIFSDGFESGDLSAWSSSTP